MTTWDLANQRLHNQRLVGTPLDTPDAVVRWLGAVQAQDYAGAKWAIAQRTRGATSAALDQLLADGAILRTHILRPTWHFVMPADIRWMLKLTAPRVHAVSAYYYRKMELDDATFGRSQTLLANALQGGKHLTRTELAKVLDGGGIPADGLRLGYLLMRAELDAIICSGPLRGKQFTYALLDERAPQTKSLERDEALAELTRRYFVSHGPATAHDFAWWSGLTVADARAGIEMAKSHLLSERVGDKTYWLPPATTSARLNTPVAHLLPNYDEHLVAYKDHDPSFDPAVLKNLAPQEPALMAHIVTIDGLVAGGWKRTVERRAVTITTDLLVDLNPAEQSALRAAADRYSQFMELPVTLENGRDSSLRSE